MTGKRIGYVRVSTADQNTERQLIGVELDKTFTDHASGKDIQRPQLTAALNYIREGDTLVIHSMDRLARSFVDMLQLVKDLTGRGVRVEFVKEAMTFTGDDSAASVLMLHIMGACAQFERSMLLERQREGIAIAKQAGKYRGRAPKLDEARKAELMQRVANREPRAAIARDMGISRATLYTYLNA